MVLFVALMCVAMSCTISLAMSIINFGFSPGFLVRWLRAWALSFLIAWPTAYIFVPQVRRLVDRIAR